MTQSDDPHLPSDEFRARLKAELKRAYRAEVQFGRDHVTRARTVGIAIGLAAGAVFALTFGLVLGASTTNASAEGLAGRRGDTASQSGLAKLATPVRNAITAFTCPAPSTKANVVQQGIPVVSAQITPAKSSVKLAGILGLRELPDGRVLVNDVAKRQVRLFDKSLNTVAITLDSAPGSARSYGPTQAVLMRWAADSTLFAPIGLKDALVLDGDGKVSHAVAFPTYDNGRLPFPVNFAAPQFSDEVGHLFSKGSTLIVDGKTSDSVPILRADLNTRQVETLGWTRLSSTTRADGGVIGGKHYVTMTVQAAPVVDTWTVLSDGTVAIVRGQDYHVDWLFADGTKGGTTKLAFDWKRLSDEDKQKLIDSARVVRDSQVAIVNARKSGTNARSEPADPGSTAGANRGRGGGGGSAAGGDGVVQRFEFVPPSGMPDFFPPVFANAAMADLDGNLWILPTSSAQSQHGELVYDVVNPKRGLFERARMPAGTSIAGFGKGGVIYLQAGDRVNGFTLERATVDHIAPK